MKKNIQTSWSRLLSRKSKDALFCFKNKVTIDCHEAKRMFGTKVIKILEDELRLLEVKGRMWYEETYTYGLNSTGKKLVKELQK